MSNEESISTSPPNPPNRRRLLKVTAAVVAVLVLSFVFNMVRLVKYTIPESYAAWTTGSLMVEYLGTHTNQWPRSWEDLRAATNSMYENGKAVYVPLDRLMPVVKIDWSVDPAKLRQMLKNDPTKPLNVITRLDGKPLQAAWGPDTEPNGKIAQYLLKP